MRARACTRRDGKCALVGVRIKRKKRALREGTPRSVGDANLRAAHVVALRSIRRTHRVDKASSQRPLPYLLAS
jgi:hypothetical protein